VSTQPKKLVGIGIGRYTLISYSPKLSSSELVKFHYALTGRGKQSGLLQKTHSTKLANSVILAPKAHTKEVLDFLRTWKCSISKKDLSWKSTDEDRLRKQARELVSKRRDISDVILVDASLISKKANSAPVVCLLTHSKTPERIAQDFQKKVGLPVIFVQADQLFTSKYSSLVDALKQGTSLITSKTSAPKTLFVYSTKHLKGSDKVRFFYELKGRGKQKGIIESTKSEFFAKSVIITPSNGSRKLGEFLTKWKCQFEKMEVAESV
jgi:hypothetical protein